MSVLRLIYHKSANPNELTINYVVSERIDRSVFVEWVDPIPQSLFRECAWYAEEFLDEADSASLFRANVIRQELVQIGAELFRTAFCSSTEAYELWQLCRQSLSDLHFELDLDSAADHPLWELMRETISSEPLCLLVRSFIRKPPLANRSGEVPQPSSAPRLLLVISRPGGDEDVEYRSIATDIFRTLSTSRSLEITILRPPTFTECAKTLRDAHNDNRPFDVVHFDGHGVSTDSNPEGVQDGAFLVFESETPGDGHLVSAQQFGALASECRVKAVVLNACRSAYQSFLNFQERIGRPPLSFAQSLTDQGVPCTVAMKYNVYVASAKRFVSEFYRQVVAGRTVAVAASLAQKHLTTSQERHPGDPLAIDDWLVPTVYQAGQDFALICPHSDQAVADNRDAVLGRALPPPPELGFIGSSDALLKLDRAFDDSNIVMLFGLAGAGKTATAIEFSKWYTATNPRIRQAVFTSLETVRRVADVFGAVEPLISDRAGHWDWNDAAHRRRAIDLLSATRTFWVWDNAESLDEISSEERSQLGEVLRQAAEAGLKVLLTARDRQESWLGYLVTTIYMPRLRAAEALELCRHVLARLDRRNVPLSFVFPIVEYADGNPLTLQVSLAGYLETTDSPTDDSARRFVDGLRTGEILIQETPGRERSRSLAASLQYGFSRTFQSNEVRVLTLVSLFRSFVNTNVIVLMGTKPVDPAVLGLQAHDFSWELSELRGWTLESLDSILRRASRIGLLRHTTNQNYWLHPAIHQHLSPYLERYFPEMESLRPQRAFAESIGVFGIFFTLGYNYGGRETAIDALLKEEDNFHEALRLGHKHRWCQAMIGSLHGIFTLLFHQGRLGQWASIYSSIEGDFIDEQLMPREGVEPFWSFIVDHKLRLVMAGILPGDAEGIARMILNYEKSQAEPVLVVTDRELLANENKRLQNLAIATGRLADILREKDDPACVHMNEEALTLYQRIEDRVGTSIRLLNLGHAFKNIRSIEDLDKAEDFYRRTFDSYPETDSLARAQALGQIGAVYLKWVEKRSKRTINSGKAHEELDNAIACYETALELLPQDAFNDLIIVHNQLGAAHRYYRDGQETALDHFKRAMHFADNIGDQVMSAGTRSNVALILHNLSRLQEAGIYAAEALAIYESMDPKAIVIPQLRELIAEGGREA